MLATADPTFARFWYLTIDQDVVGVTPASVNKVITRVLTDPTGWSRMGYSFHRTTEKAARNRDPRTVIHIRLCKPAVVKRVCNIADRSCADLNLNKIYLNADRWLHGADKADLPLEDYRNALVAHEIGHLLSFDHVKCPGAGAEGDVMQEFTLRGWEGCLPTTKPTLRRAWESAGSSRRPRRRTLASYRSQGNRVGTWSPP